MSNQKMFRKWLRDLMSGDSCACTKGAKEDSDSRPYSHGDEDDAETNGSVTRYVPDVDVIHVIDYHGGAVRPVVKVGAVDLLVVKNATLHNTDQYEVTQPDVDGRANTPRLVVRRGWSFSVDITLTQNWADIQDTVTIILETGDAPQVSKRTRLKLKLGDKHTSNDTWTAVVTSHQKNKLRVRIISPPDALVGEYRIHIDTCRAPQFVTNGSDGNSKLLRYTHTDSLVLLFNPWCEEDQVFLDDELGRQEYVLNDVGKIYTGQKNNLRAKPWNFAQFESVVLDCVLYLLSKGGKNVSQRSNPIFVVRKLSALLNSLEDNGVLVGKWEEREHEYADGVVPGAWIGSEGILQQYMTTKQPVKYGQCWVFSAIFTTVCRALGIPCRSVSNFASAHDMGQNITIDRHFDSAGRPKRGENDSIWNFHVWNDVWMSRPDLPKGYGGWQAVDSTPQEQSSGIYRMGPASVVAIKRGEVYLHYDAPFVFSEVNGDVIDWVDDDFGNSRVVKVNRSSVGWNISTKKPTGQPPSGRIGPFLGGYPDDEDRLDITSEYKYNEGSTEERDAVENACTALSTRRIDAGAAGEDTGPNDVGFKLTLDTGANMSGVMIGQPFTVIYHIANHNTQAVRHVSTKVTLHAVSYTGVLVADIGPSRQLTSKLRPGEETDVSIKVLPEDYLDKIVDHGLVQISVMCRVTETDQVHVDTDTFRFIHPDVDVQVPDQVRLHVPFEASIRLANPLRVKLTGCRLRMEGPGLQRPVVISMPNIPAGGVGHKTITLTSRRTGRRQLIVSFISHQLSEVSGYTSVVVYP